MNKKALRADILLLLTAGIWGFGFVAQRSGMEYVGPFAFNGIRFILGSLSLLPIILVRRNKMIHSAEKPVPVLGLLVPSLVAGSCLFLAVIFQQFGILFTTAGNAGFITGLYVILTPIFGIFLGRKTGPATWFASVLTLTGLYFISIAGHSGSINPGDVIIVISSFFWTMHVLVIDRLMQAAGLGEASQINSLIDPVELSAGQFAICGFFSLLGAFLAEPYIGPAVERIDISLLSTGLFAWRPFPDLIMALKAGTVSLSLDAFIPILYGGLGSVGIAYTLQVIAQRDAPPAHATIILCFEGSFAALGGVLLLGEKVGMWTLLGFIFMLAGMLTTQWEVTAKGCN
jgi:drug/metabolite transporter (DMT)-like permease